MNTTGLFRSKRAWRIALFAGLVALTAIGAFLLGMFREIVVEEKTFDAALPASIMAAAFVAATLVVCTLVAWVSHRDEREQAPTERRSEP